VVEKAIEAYDNERFGPILGVSDEGSAAQTIADAAYASAKAQAHGAPNEMCVGVIIDGERMGSAGEVPIGPPEYAQVVPAASGRTFCTTNVGVRVNTRLHQPLPEFAVTAAASDERAWLDAIFEQFKPFIKTPDGTPRPLTIRLLVESLEQSEMLPDLVSKIEAGREQGTLSSRDLHRLSILRVYENEIETEEQIAEIKQLVALAAKLGVPEVAIDGKLVEAARRRINIQGLLNVLRPEAARSLLMHAKEHGVTLSYHYELDPETAARTVWTGLNSAHKEGLTAAKYGLFPLSLDQQKYVVEHIQRWLADWTPIPAFYVDTALVTEDDVFESDRCVAAARLWMEMVSERGAKVILVDAPDRIQPHRLLRTDGGPNDPGVLAMDDVGALQRHADGLGLKVLWSGGVKPDQAFELGKLGVSGIFTTGSASVKVPVHGSLVTDRRLPFQPEPTAAGVRKIHALLQGGYLCRVMSNQSITSEIEARVASLLQTGTSGEDTETALDALNATLIRGWKEYWSAST